GDLSRWLPDGNIEFLGRVDQQVKIRGFRVEPGEIENQLLKHKQIKEAVITIKEADKDSAAWTIGDKHLCAYLAAEDEIPVSDLRSELARELPDYMIPSFFVYLEKIPITTHGKVDYRALPDPLEMMSKSKNYEAPSNEIEEKIIKTWSEVLGVDKRKIGVRDNFFELGGNSLNILRTLSRLNKVFSHKISLSSLFLYKTVKDLADNIYEEEILSKLECIVKLNHGKNERNLFIIHPLHGMVYQYKELAKLLENDFNIYALQCRGLVKKSPFPESLEIMAADYIHQIRTIQPNGSYIIAAHCFGGMVAYDMVKLLEDMGLRVDRLILFNHNPFIAQDVFEYYRKKEKTRNLFAPVNNILTRFGKIGFKEQRT
ncbi:MAG: thioesterase domain-containing protein, partial [Candidatus Aminicenantes bacterium]|nr:thioesterase domain-containing protein [Candidatus Aminicenantes bacterium]